MKAAFIKKLYSLDDLNAAARRLDNGKVPGCSVILYEQ